MTHWIPALAPLPVVLPLLMAAFLSGASLILSRRAIDIIATVTASMVFVACICLAVKSQSSTITYWFGNWKPGAGGQAFPLGIVFAIDPAGAALAAFVTLLMLAAFAFSWQYFETVKSLFHAMMLVFLAAMCGLCLTGDIFNLFVWFELMSAAGIALCGYHADDTGPLQGAINFAVMNTLGAFLSLTGVAMLYAFTGTLNFAEAGLALSRHDPSGSFTLIVFLFIASGFLVKAAVVPFQFWLADAHAVAPTPVCILFSGVMVELGLYAILRIYSTVFAAALAPVADHVQHIFIAAGALTAVVGAVECFGQRHLKRMLAFSTISHVGLMLMGGALLTSTAVGGAAMYLIGHGATKAALFICAGILLHRFKSVDEIELRGAGKPLPVTRLVMLAGVLGLAGVPPFGTFFGAGRIDEAAKAGGFEWMSIVYIAAGALTAGAALRVTLGIFFGMGEIDETGGEAPKIPMDRETKGQQVHTPATMWVTAVLMMLIAATVALWPGAQALAWHAAIRLLDTNGYSAAVLQNALPTLQSAPPENFPGLMPPAITLLLAITLAMGALFYPAAGRAGAALAKVCTLAMRPLRAMQSGVIGDYVVWFVVGIAGYGALLLMHG